MSALSRWAGSWRVAGRIARRDAVRARGRTALVATMIGLPVLVGAAGGVLLQSTVISPVREMEWALGAHVQARVDAYANAGLRQDPVGGGLSYGSDSTPAPAIAEYTSSLTAALPEGDLLVRGTTGGASVLGPHGVDPLPVTVEELPLADMAAVIAAPVASGALPSTPGEVALSASAARWFGASVGDVLAITPDGATAPVTVRVSAVLAPWPTGVPVAAAAGSLLPDAPNAGGSMPGDGITPVSPEWFVLGTEPVTWADVLAVNALGSVVTSRAVVLDPPDVPSVMASDGGTRFSTAGIVAGVGTLGLVEAILIIGPAFAVGARRSQRQLLLLAAAGGDRRTMRRVVLAGGVITGLAAATTGVVAGLGVAAVIQRIAEWRGSFLLPDLRVPWWMAPALVVLATFVTTAAAALPARRSARMDVVAALAGRRAEARPHPAVPVIGVVLGGIGLVVALVGATTARMLFIVGGIVGLELGVVLAAGGIVSLVGMLAPRLPLAGRFAARDAARQRLRTAPALAAVLAALAGVTAALVYIQSADAQRHASQESLGVPGTVAVQARMPGPGESKEVEPTASELAAAEAALRADAIVGEVAPVMIAVPHAGPAPAGAATAPPGTYSSMLGLTIDVVRAPDQECPVWTTGHRDRPARVTHIDDRCDAGSGFRMTVWSDPGSLTSRIVDDGTAVRLLGVPGSGDAADALGAGKVVVRSVHDLQPNGTVHVAVHDNRADGSVEVAAGDFPAVVADLHNASQLGLVLPPSVAARLGLTTRVAGLVATTTAMPSDSDQVRLGRESGSAFGGVYVQRPPSPLSYVLWILVGAALVVGLGATGLSLSLAASESVPDLATLGAVGAAPRMRRRIAAAQAGVLTLTGAALGASTGLALGHVLVTMKRYGGQIANPTWVTRYPWPALVAVLVGVPALAMGGAWLLTRSRLPMVRRVVG